MLLAEFRSPGETTWTVPDDVISIRVLVVGGGGGGVVLGGGGAGGQVIETALEVSPGDRIPICVGRGGEGGVGTDRGGDGEASIFGSVVAAGGGGGGSTGAAVRDGRFGSGGGSASTGAGLGSILFFEGGNGTNASPFLCGGGAGAGGRGMHGSEDGAGGLGLFVQEFSEYGDNGYFGGGGGGGSYVIGLFGAGTHGGGHGWGGASGTAAQDGANGTGGGGGGGGFFTSGARVGGHGGTGIVLIKKNEVSSAGSSSVSGIVQINGSPAQRTVRAFGYNPTVQELDGTTVNLSKSLGHATSDPDTGEYTIDLLAGYARQVFVVAFDDYGEEFQPDLALAVGDRVHPTTPNGYVWECTGSGTLPSEEPAWVIDTETAQLYGTASMIAKPFYRPMVHGPVIPEVVDINKNDLLAALDAASALNSSDYSLQTWAVLEDAVQAGQAVYDDPEADQATVDAATQAIDDALSGLEAPKLVPTVIGEAFGGGFYGGDIEDDGQWYKLIVADVEADVYGLLWMYPESDWPQASSNTDGPSNTLSMAGDARFEAGNHCLDYRGGGFDDWYMPARSELQAIYENLGHNKNPPAGFESGGTQAFHGSNYYWCSTQRESSGAWARRFSDGHDNYSSKRYGQRQVRPVRRIPFTPEGA